MMFVLSNFINAVATVLRIAIEFEIVVIIVHSILSWFPFLRYHPINQFLFVIAGLILNPLKRFIPPIGPFDITPFIAILLLIFIDSFLVSTLFDIAIRLR